MENELREISNKDLSTLSIEELFDFKKYVTEYTNKAEETVQLKKKRLLYNIIGTLCVLILALFAYRSFFSFYANKKAFTINICITIALGILSYALKVVLYTKPKKDIARINDVCYRKLNKIEKQLALTQNSNNK